MKIEQLLKQLIGREIRSLTFTIKTAGKLWQVDNDWHQEIVLVDDTGEMLADVLLGKRIPLPRGSQIHIFAATVQDAVHLGKDKKKLAVRTYILPTQIGEPEEPFQYGDPSEVVKSKIRCLLVCAYISANTQPSKKHIVKWTEYILTGK